MIVALSVLWFGFRNHKLGVETSSNTTTPTSHNTSPSPSRTGNASTVAGKGSAAASTGKSYEPTSNGSSTAGSQLAAPTGQLLNLHSIFLSANPAMESVCQTLPNSSCDIRLTNGATIKYVGAKNTGSNGFAIFDWTANGVGLFPGKWTVQAVVTQNSQTGVSASDYLEVSS